MGKVKSAVFIAFYTLLIAVLGFACFVSFPYGENNVNKFNSILSMTQKDSDLGGKYGSNEDESLDYYFGGGYVGVYYPEGVVSAQEYEKNLAGYEATVASYEAKVNAAETGSVEKAELENKLEEAREIYEEYAANYVKYKSSLYLFKGDDENDGIVGADDLPTEEFKTSFASAVQTIVNRYAHLRQDGIRVDVCDEYTVRVFAPKEMDSEQTALVYLGYTGPMTVKYGSSADTATVIMPVRSSDAITDYVKAVKAVSRNGGNYVLVEFTKEGKEIVKNRTAGASSESSNTIYFNVGDEQVISLTVQSPLEDNLYISSQSYTKEIATTIATLLNSALGGTENDITFRFGSTYHVEAIYGNNALIYLYIAFGVLSALMLVFFFVRYHLLGFVHLYTYLLFTIATVLCVWSIPFLTLSVETFTAFMLLAGVLCLSDAVTFEYARKEYALGKTMSSSVKTGYKKCMWHLFDLHIALALVGFVGFGIALTNLTSFLFTVGLLALFSGVASLVINRFTWATMMALAKNKRAFCNFKVEESDDE